MQRLSLFVAFTLVALVWFSLLAAPALAGQVVTDDIRQWARQAVSKESSADFKAARNTVAVLYFHNRTKDPALDFLEMGMTIMLITDLAKLEEVQVVERTQLQALVQELEMGTSGLVSPDTAPRVGRLLRANYLVYGALKPGKADAILVGSDVLDLPGDALLGQAASGGTLEKMLQMEKQLLFEIIRLLQVDLTEAEEKALREPVVKDIKALEFFVRGVQSSDRGDYQAAADNYQKALQADPDMDIAKGAVKELHDLRLISRPVGGQALLKRLQKRASVNGGPFPDVTTRRLRSEPVSVLGLGGRNADIRIDWQP